MGAQAAGTTMRISAANRDALAAVVTEHGDAATLDDALRIVLWEWHGYRAVVDLAADPDALAEYRAESQALAEGGVADGLSDLPPYESGNDDEHAPAARHG